MDLDKLSAERKWDEVFHCLKIDVNSTIELGSIKGKDITQARFIYSKICIYLYKLLCSF